MYQQMRIKHTHWNLYPKNENQQSSLKSIQKQESTIHTKSSSNNKNQEYTLKSELNMRIKHWH